MSTAATSSTPKSAVYVLLSRIAYELQEILAQNKNFSPSNMPGTETIAWTTKVFTQSVACHLELSIKSCGSDHKLLTYVRDMKDSGK